ncbi:MAG: hypothetical protein SVQ76_00070 [Candidatus Nanohaloarchaea archaeon]|nr:hypothetical protein [Candidatus Nanohaloarchaea archaeon]
MSDIHSVRLPERYGEAVERLAGTEYDSQGDLIRTAASNFQPFLGVVPLHNFEEHLHKVTFRDSAYGEIESFYEAAEEAEVEKAQAMRNAVGYEIGEIEYDFEGLRRQLDELERLEKERGRKNGDIENLENIWEDINGD